VVDFAGFGESGQDESHPTTGAGCRIVHEDWGSGTEKVPEMLPVFSFCERKKKAARKGGLLGQNFRTSSPHAKRVRR